MIGIQDIRQERYTINLKIKEDRVLITINGNIDVSDPGVVLSPFFQKVQEYVIDMNLKHVDMDLSKLNFLNSSGIKCIVAWIGRIPFLAQNKRYCVTMKYNPDITWQETSLRTIKMLLSDYITLEKV